MQPVRVLILIRTSFPLGREAIHGALDYIHERAGWDWHHEEPSPERADALRGWQPAGVVAHVSSPRVRNMVSGMGVPVVNTSGVLADPGFPTVTLDNRGMGATAAAYFADQGYRHFACHTHDATDYARLRTEGFVTELARRGAACDVFNTHARGDRLAAPEEHEEWHWLRRLPRPTAMFLADDARTIPWLARHMDLKVPGEVALLAADSGDLASAMSDQPLSGVEVPMRRVGYEAVRLLERLIAGAPGPAAPVLIRPTGVSERRSTALPHVYDSEVEQALGYIRDHATDQLTVEDLLGVVPISRRALERRFKAVTGETIYDHVLLVRVREAQRLLVETDLDMASIAAAVGLPGSSALARLVRRATDLTPTQYRRRYTPR